MNNTHETAINFHFRNPHMIFQACVVTMTVLHLWLYLLVLLISTSGSIASPSQADPRLSLVGRGQPGPSRLNCSGVFTWNPQKTTDDPICIPVRGVRYACKLSSCTFRNQPLTQQNFFFRPCYWDNPQNKELYFEGDVHPTEMYYTVKDSEATSPLICACWESLSSFT